MRSSGRAPILIRHVWPCRESVPANEVSGPRTTWAAGTSPAMTRRWILLKSRCERRCKRGSLNYGSLSRERITVKGGASVWRAGSGIYLFSRQKSYHLFYSTRMMRHSLVRVRNPLPTNSRILYVRYRGTTVSANGRIQINPHKYPPAPPPTPADQARSCPASRCA
jgi:hypothetical protein